MAKAKSTKHQESLGSFDNFRAPWQSEAGEDSEIDKPRLAKLIYNLKLDLAKSKDAGEDLKEAVTTAEAERDEAKDQAADGSGAEAQKKIDSLQKKVDDLTAERDGLVKDKETAEARAEVLGEFEAKYPKAAKYVKGETTEELEESLKEVAEDWGIDLKNLDNEEHDEDEDNDDEPVVRNRPTLRSLLNPLDPQSGKGAEKTYDPDKVAQDIILGGNVFG